MGQKIFECPSVSKKESEGRPQGQVTQIGQVQQGAQAHQGGGPHNNRFYALHAIQEVEKSLDMIMGMLRVF